jgi:hypothetical protein
MAKMFFGSRPRSRLLNMTWKEVSGVDHPANEEEGWMVMKAKQKGDPDGETDECAEELAEELFETDFSDCPADVQAAVGLLQTWLAQEGYDGLQSENSEEPGEALAGFLKGADFSTAPDNVKQAAANLGAYLAADTDDDDDDEQDAPNVFPPVGIQMYPGKNKREGNYPLRPGNGSAGFAGALNDFYGNVARRARAMDLTKAFGGKKAPPFGKGGKPMAGKFPTYKSLARAIRKAVTNEYAGGERFYGNDFGMTPFSVPGESYFQGNVSDSAGASGMNYPPQGGGSGSFYSNWTNPGPYQPTGDDGVSDGELANGLNNVARVSAAAAKVATKQAFDQFVGAGWPGFSSKVADIIANYSARVTSPVWHDMPGGDDSPPLNLPANIAKSQSDALDTAKEEIHKAVEDYKNFVLTGMTQVAKRTFSDASRKKLAASGAAMRDGSFPIVNRGDLLNARHAVGRAKNPSAARAHIKRRAAALGVKLPANTWGS